MRAPKTRECAACGRAFTLGPSANGNARCCSPRCRYRLRDRSRSARGEVRHSSARPPPSRRPDALAADLGPEWPLLTPPAVQAREREALERRVREAWEAGVTHEALLERFGALGLHILSRLVPQRARERGMSVPLGLPL